MLYNVITCYRYTLLYREISQKSNKRQDLKKAQDLKLGKSLVGTQTMKRHVFIKPLKTN